MDRARQAAVSQEMQADRRLARLTWQTAYAGDQRAIPHGPDVQPLAPFLEGNDGTLATSQIWTGPQQPMKLIDRQYCRRWIIGVSSEGHAVMSVKVRPELKDSGFEAREAPWRESKTAEPSDNMLERSMCEASGCKVK